ncbi:MAG: SoxR reducing system RseC family protein [Spirochaetota bacterium]
MSNRRTAGALPGNAATERDHAAAGAPRDASRGVTERATVIAVGEESVTVRCSPTETCASCSSLLCSPRERTYEAVVDEDRLAAKPLAKGDLVAVEVPESHALARAALLFALPLALFAVLYAALGFTGSETQRVAGGFAGLAAGFGLAVLVSRWIPETRPRVVAVYREPELEPLRVPGPDTTS